MSFVTLGVVSNVWATLLPRQSLGELCARAAAEGMGYVELRQRALGECEAPGDGGGSPRPLPDRLGELARAHPTLGFNLAIEVPFLTQAAPVDETMFAAGVEAARALGGSPPLLRLVDTTPAFQPVPPDVFVGCVATVRRLARSAAARGVRLALENATQPLSTLRQLMEIVEQELGNELNAGCGTPVLCWDAANALKAVVSEPPAAALASFSVDEIGLFHFKQLRDGEVQPDVGDGELDWRRILRPLHERGYQGPALFEIPPGDDIDARLARSRAYIEALLQEVTGEPR